MRYMILVDPQRDFFTGKFRNPEAIKIMPNICKAIECHRGPIIATKDSHTDFNNSVEGRMFGEHCVVGTVDWDFPNEIHNALDIQGSYYGYVSKNTFGSFALINHIKDIEGVIKKQNFDMGKFSNIPSFVILGLVTDICVISNALLLRSAFPNSPITVYSDCCAGTTAENHEAALRIMQTCCINIEKRFA